MTKQLTSHLRKMCDRFGKDFKAGRIAEMTASFYHPDAVMEGRDMLAEKGHQAIGRIFEEARAVYSSLVIELEEVTCVGDVAFANFTNRNGVIGGGEEIHRGLMIWVREGDDWLVVRDFFFAENAPLSNSMALYPAGSKMVSTVRARRG